MKIAHDLFAETNPAFGTYAAVSFCREFCSNSSQGPSIALFFLALPIALSQDTQQSFDGTNKNTGLIAWLNRYPDLRLNLGARLDTSLDIVSASLKLGLMAQALTMREDGSLELGSRVPPKSSAENLPSEPKKVIRRAKRLGGWMGEAGTVGSIYSAFGVTL